MMAFLKCEEADHSKVFFLLTQPVPSNLHSLGTFTFSVSMHRTGKGMAYGSMDFLCLHHSTNIASSQVILRNKETGEFFLIVTSKRRIVKVINN